jgi:hypothetical protein
VADAVSGGVDDLDSALPAAPTHELKGVPDRWALYSAD